jgi:hypothetical protein
LLFGKSKGGNIFLSITIFLPPLLSISQRQAEGFSCRPFGSSIGRGLWIEADTLDVGVESSNLFSILKKYKISIIFYS